MAVTANEYVGMLKELLLLVPFGQEEIQPVFTP